MLSAAAIIALLGFTSAQPLLGGLGYGHGLYGGYGLGGMGAYGAGIGAYGAGIGAYGAGIGVVGVAGSPHAVPYPAAPYAEFNAAEAAGVAADRNGVARGHALAMHSTAAANIAAGQIEASIATDSAAQVGQASMAPGHPMISGGVGPTPPGSVYGGGNGYAHPAIQGVGHAAIGASVGSGAVGAGLGYGVGVMGAGLGGLGYGAGLGMGAGLGYGAGIGYGAGLGMGSLGYGGMGALGMGYYH